MGRFAARLVALASCCLLLTACNDTTTVIATPPAVAHPSAASLPFTYQAAGESSSPSFHVDASRNYTVTYHLAGSADLPNCKVTLDVVSTVGEDHQIVPATVLKVTDVKDGSAPVPLAAGDWRFQEGGGCSWKVTVTG
jgi:hypothetical protein